MKQAETVCMNGWETTVHVISEKVRFNQSDWLCCICVYLPLVEQESHVRNDVLGDRVLTVLSFRLGTRSRVQFSTFLG